MDVGVFQQQQPDHVSGSTSAGPVQGGTGTGTGSTVVVWSGRVPRSLKDAAVSAAGRQRELARKSKTRWVPPRLELEVNITVDGGGASSGDFCYVAYQFTDDTGRRWTQRVNVRNLAGIERGDQVTVYYQRKNPDVSILEGSEVPTKIGFLDIFRGGGGACGGGGCGGGP